MAGEVGGNRRGEVSVGSVEPLWPSEVRAQQFAGADPGRRQIPRDNYLGQPGRSTRGRWAHKKGADDDCESCAITQTAGSRCQFTY